MISRVSNRTRVHFIVGSMVGYNSSTSCIESGSSSSSEQEEELLLHQMKNNLPAAAGSDAVSCSCLWESCWTAPEVYSESGDELVVNTANSTSTAAELGTASSPRLITNFRQTDDMILSSAASWLSGLQDDPLTTAFISHGMVLDMCSNS